MVCSESLENFKEIGTIEGKRCGRLRKSSFFLLTFFESRILKKYENKK